MNGTYLVYEATNEHEELVLQSSMSHIRLLTLTNEFTCTGKHLYINTSALKESDIVTRCFKAGQIINKVENLLNLVK